MTGSRFIDKVALVTGGASGIGRASVDRFGRLDIAFANAGTRRRA